MGVGSSLDKTVEVSLTRQQVCCLLALGFFNVLEPMPGTDYQQLTFIAFVAVDFFGSQRNKLICLLKYFERLMDAEKADNQEFLSMNISVARKRIAKSDPDLFWGKSTAVLLPLEPQPTGLIEDAHGCLQVDFANAYIGGGVLGLGNVQVCACLYMLQHVCTFASLWILTTILSNHKPLSNLLSFMMSLLTLSLAARLDGGCHPPG